MKKTIAELFLLAFAATFSGLGCAGESKPQFDLQAYEETLAREDRDARMTDLATAACEVGFHTRALANSGAACAVAYEKAIVEKRFEQALNYAVIGCRTYGSAESCRNAGGLPLWMGNQRLAVPVSFGTELKRLAEFICFSGASIKAAKGRDVTARECTYLARRFSLAGDPAYLRTLRPEAKRFFDAIYEPSFAARLHVAACERLMAADGCKEAQLLAHKAAVATRVALED